MKVRILFYVTPKFKWKYIVNWLISLWTRSKYSHCEVWTPRDMTNDVFTQVELVEPAKGDIFTACGHTTITVTEPVYKINIFGTAYTATMRGDHNGTVKRPASEVLDKPWHWEFVEVETRCEYDYDAMLIYMDDEVKANKGYSKWDLLKFLSPVHFPDNKRNICSEFCNNSLCVIDILKKVGIISPKQLHKKLTKLGYETKKLKG